MISYVDILQQRFPQFNIQRKKEIEFLYNKILQTKVSFYLDKSVQKIQKFKRDFPYLYRYFIEPLYFRRSDLLYIYFQERHFYMLFCFIENGNNLFSFFDNVEKYLRGVSNKALQKNHEKWSHQIFLSNKSIQALSSQCTGFFGEIFTEKNISEVLEDQIQLEKIEEDNKHCRCDYRCVKPPILIESKSKLPGYGCKGDESIVNDFLINHIFRLKFFFNYVCPEFCADREVEMSHFGGYEEVNYNQCVSHTCRIIQKYFKNTKLSTDKPEQELQVIHATISELYDQFPSSKEEEKSEAPRNISKERQLQVTPDSEKPTNIESLVDSITNLPFCKNLLEEGVKQLLETELADKFLSKKILHVYWPGYQKMCDGSLYGERSGSIGSERFRKNLREILNGLKQGCEIELWISDGKTLCQLSGNIGMINQLI